MSTWTSRAWPWAGLVAGLAVLSWYAIQYPLNHDVGWWLHVARSMMEGEVIYRSVIEVNPPLYGYLAMVPLLAADYTGLSAPTVAKASILILMLLCILVATLLSIRVTEHVWAGIALGLMVAVGVLGLPGTDFGQREHVMFALVVPYLLFDAYRSKGNHVPSRLSVSIGLGAGIGFALKPHFGVIFLLLEATLSFIRRDWQVRFRRSEFTTVVLVALGYGLILVAVFPEYLEFLWNSRRFYASFAGMDRSSMLITSNSMLLVAVAFAYTRWRGGRRDMRFVVLPFTVFAGAAWITAVAQGKGWTYHFYPSFAGAVIAGLALCISTIAARKGKGLRRSQIVGATGCAIIAALIWVSHMKAYAYADYRRHVITEREGILNEAEAESFVVLSPMVSDAFPLVNYTALEWASPFSTLWWLPFAHGRPGPAPRAPVSAAEDSVEAAFRQALVGSMWRQQPDVVFVDTAPNPRFEGQSFPYVTYLSGEPRFRELWVKYEVIGTAGRFTVYARSGTREKHAP